MEAENFQFFILEHNNNKPPPPRYRQKLTTFQLPTPPPPKTDEKSDKEIQAYKILAKKIDRRCRVIFPILFLIFNCLYWSKYKFLSKDLASALDGATGYTQVESLSS